MTVSIDISYCKVSDLSNSTAKKYIYSYIFRKMATYNLYPLVVTPIFDSMGGVIPCVTTTH